MVTVTQVIGGFTGLVLLIFAVMIYNNLIMLRRNIDKAWANIDVLLKQRRNEIPKLVDTVQEYADYEQSTLQDLTEAREKAEQADTPEEQIEAEKGLGAALNGFFARAEEYPELKASENFQQLQTRISSLENQIADRREFYNDSVNTYNIRIHQIPYVFLAKPLGYQEKELFEVSEEERADVNMAELFNE